MLSFLRDLFRILPGVVAAIFVGVVSTLFLVFPRVVNWLADLLGNMGTPLELGPVAVRLAILVVIWGVLGYFFISRPVRQFRIARSSKGLVVRKGQGIGFMDVESVRQQIYATVAQVSEVQRMEVSVINNLGRAEVYLNVLSGNRINAAAKKQEIFREIKKVVEDKLGIRMAVEPVINIKLVPIFEDLPYASPADASYASAYSGLRTLPTPSAPAAEIEVEAPEPAKAASAPKVEQAPKPKSDPAPKRSLFGRANAADDKAEAEPVEIPTESAPVTVDKSTPVTAPSSVPVEPVEAPVVSRRPLVMNNVPDAGKEIIVEAKATPVPESVAIKHLEFIDSTIDASLDAAVSDSSKPAAEASGSQEK